MESKYLPIGSIVTLNNINKKIMIIGYYSIKYQNVVKMYDYLGCIYPEGLLQLNELHSFNHSDIKDILFVGFIDDSFKVLNNNLLGQLKVDSSNSKTNDNFVNVKYNDNGVVSYDELVEFKVDPKIYELLDSIKNPFINDENVTNNDTPLPTINDNINENSLDNKSLENKKEIENNFINNYSIDDNEESSNDDIVTIM